MYNRIGVNSKKQMTFINRNNRKHKMSNRNYYIYSYDGEKAYNIDEEDYYNDALNDDTKEEWDEYPEIENIDENDLANDSDVYDEDGEVWEKYDGYSDDAYDNAEEDDDHEDHECPCECELTFDPKKALIVSAGVLAGLAAVTFLVKRRK